MEKIKGHLPLSHKDNLFFNAFQFAAIGMALVAPDGKWLQVNKALCTIVGYSEKELLQLTFQDITHPDDLEEDLDNVQKMLYGELESYQMEKRYLHKDGSIIYILLSVSLVRDEMDMPLFFISQIQNITDRKLLETELIKQARVDALTGLNNRRSFYELAEKELIRGGRYNDPMVMLMIDIDRFKNINDRFGHSAGDLALIRMADACNNGLRSFDLFGRIGGEEFSALLVKTNVKIGYQVAERLRRLIENLIIPTDKGVVRFTISIGGVAFSGYEQSLDHRLKQADEALFEAKTTGRNKVVIIDDLPSIKQNEMFKSGMLHLEWDTSYECGNKLIDEQHQNLFNLSNLLLNTMIDQQEKGACQKHIDKLNSTIANHFSMEEEIIKTSGYPNFKEHKQKHEDLLERAAEMAVKYQSGYLELGDIFNFLVVEVVREHMLSEDTKFFEHLKG